MSGNWFPRAALPDGYLGQRLDDSRHTWLPSLLLVKNCHQCAQASPEVVRHEWKALIDRRHRTGPLVYGSKLHVRSSRTRSRDLCSSSRCWRGCPVFHIVESLRAELQSGYCSVSMYLLPIHLSEFRRYLVSNVPIFRGPFLTSYQMTSAINGTDRPLFIEVPTVST